MLAQFPVAPLLIPVQVSLFVVQLKGVEMYGS